MFRKLQLGLFFGIALSVMVGQVYSADAMAAPTPEAKAAVEKTIKVCEAKYMQVKALGAKLNIVKPDLNKLGIKKPGMLSLPKAKREYEAKVREVMGAYEAKAQEMILLKKAFDLNFNEFTQFTNEKIRIRSAKTVRAMSEANNEYSSNCTRFAEGLTGFVDWALTGKGQAGKRGQDIAIYKYWVEDAKKS